ncbi:P-loop containing nucleoside triphosphate hydrolase protein [Paraphysoderma sedebokerense]|nr:P-loop containing nucleoside triphosphate hydrolase protein [Paraphysoderma sedebokerense]
MINAGPGTGKTSTLVARIFRLLAKGKSPHHIIALTFSNEAQRSLLNRIQVTAKTICDNDPKSLYMPFVKTIDAFATMISDWYLPKILVLMEDDDFRSQVLLKLKNYPDYDEKKLEKQLDEFYKKLKGTQELVDEFQDVDNLQYKLITLLVPPKSQENNESSSAITVVGDDDQAIYAFRGGNIEPI